MKSLTLLVLVAALFQSADAHAQGKQLTGPYTPAASPALAPDDAQKKFVVPEGFEVRLFAAEPDIINPVAMAWDERGRLWVVELYEYPLGAAPGQKPRDRIKILEDTTGSGHADKVTVFADGLNLATGIQLGYGGVFVGQAPDLLFLEDTKHTGVADKRTVLLSGFGLEDRHELLNGFTWGPDGWLYMTHGVFTHSKVKIPEASTPGVEVTAAVARYHPRTKKFEVFADGTSNPWGVDFDRYGNAFVSACVIDHLFHMAPGGIYVRQGGTPVNPYSYELLPSIVNHKHHMAAYAGIQIYQGDQFPPEWQGEVLFGNIHQNAINHDHLIPNGSSFKARAAQDFLTTSDGWFRPVSEQVGPDGALWIADWYDKYPCYQNAQADPEGVDRERGRIWRVVYTGKKPGAKVPSRPDVKMDLAKLSTEKLVPLLAHSNIWQRRMAERLLAERCDPAAIEPLKRMVKSGATLESRLFALWTLHSSEQLEDGTLTGLFLDKEAALRAWSARLAGERRSGSEDIVSGLQTLGRDPDPSVRLAVAVAAREFVSGSLTVDTPLPDSADVIDPARIIISLVGASADAQDPLLPFMIWEASEPLAARDPEPGLQWLADNALGNMPLSGILARKLMRRIYDMQDVNRINQAVEFLAQIAGTDDAFTSAVIDGLIEGQSASSLKPTVKADATLAKLINGINPGLADRALRLGTLWGDTSAVQGTLDRVNDGNASVEDRLKAIQAVRKLKSDAARNAMLQLISQTNNPTPLVLEAIRALGEIGGDKAGDDLVQRWKAFTPEAREAVVQMLASRKPWALSLLGAIENKSIAVNELPASVIRTLTQSKDIGIRLRAVNDIGNVRPPNADKVKIIAAKKQMILAGDADLKAGHEIAKKTCLVCHKFYGEGAEVGPDLTGSGRSTLDALLANVIDPNQVVGKGYENVEVETKDGRTLSGRMVENTDSHVKLLSIGPKEDVIPKPEIASLKVSQLSVMPEGLEQMPDADFRNLILFILNGQPEKK